MGNTPRFEGASQLRTLFTIRLYFEQHGSYPTIAEIAELRGVTKPAIDGHLKYLNAHGYIRKRPGSDIRLTAKGWKA